MRRTAAWLALIAFVAGLVLPVSIPLHAPDDADAAWGASGLLGRDGALRFAPPGSEGEDEHCAICHWLRALNHSVPGANPRGPHFDLVRHVGPRPAVTPNSGSSIAAPARAPPALL
jgi:hypothetical protein